MAEEATEQQQTNEPVNREKAPEETRTFTQEELNRVVGERLTREREKFQDYEDLKARSEKLAEIEEQNKTAEEKRQEELGAAQWELEETRNKLLRYQAANKHQIGEDYLDLLGSGDEKEINARAEALGKLLSDSRELEALRKELESKSNTSRPGSGRPADNLRPGASPVETPIEDESSYPASWFPGHSA